MSAAVVSAAALRPVFCVTEHTRRDLEVAEAVCRGTFTHAGLSLDLGLEPDWLSAELPDDPEWAIEWRKFYFALDLGHAFQVTSEIRFIEAWERLVRSFIEQVAPELDRSDVIGRRILNWIYAWQRFAAAPASRDFSARFADALQASLDAQLAQLERHLTPERNHRTFELYALFVAALALPALDPDGRRLRFAVDELALNLLTDVRPDGVHREASTHYHHVALRTFLGVRENARRFGLILPDGFDARLKAACAFAMHAHRPDGGIPALSDSDSGSYLDLLELAGELLGRDDFLYVGTRCRRGRAPSLRHASFDEGGYYVQRSGWRGPHERYLIFDCGPLGDGSHGHYDALSVEIAAGGRPLLVDPGRYVYSDRDGWRHWFKGTAAHNTVTVDGVDQTPYRPGAPKGPLATARLIARSGSPDGLDVLVGEVRSPIYEVIHQRRVIFVDDHYWLIEDRLLGERPHRYDLRFHLAPTSSEPVLVAPADGAPADGATLPALTDDRHAEATASAPASDAAAENAPPPTPRSVARPPAGGECATLLTPGLALLVMPGSTAAIEPGWVAPSYGHRQPAPVLSVAIDGAGCATFVSLIMPLAESAIAPSLNIRQRFGVTTAEVTMGATRDLIAWGSARTAWFRSSHGRNERVVRCS